MRIAINGCGIAGPALAWWLGEYGYQPVLFEKAPALRTGGYMIDFWGMGYDIAEKMGVLPAIKEKGYKIEKLKIVGDEGEEKARLDIKAMSSVVDNRFTSVARSDVSKALYDACGGIETHFGKHITAVEQTEDYAVVELSDGTREKFDLVIGADGLHSEVRSAAFGPEENYAQDMGVYVSAYTAEGYQPREELAYIMHQGVKKQVARVSLRYDKTLFLLTFRSELTKSAPRDTKQEKQLLRDVFHDQGWEVPAILKRMDDTDDFYFDRVSQIQMDHWSKGRVALLGDAAACVSLLAGEGTGLAFVEAYVLAGELRRANGDYKEAFRQYEQRLQEFLKNKQKSARKMVSFFAPDNGFEMWLMRTVVSALFIPFLSKFLLGTMLRDDVSLPKYDFPGS